MIEYKSRKATISPIHWMSPAVWVFKQILYQTDAKASLFPDTWLVVIHMTPSLINCEYLNYLS